MESVKPLIKKTKKKIPTNFKQSKPTSDTKTQPPIHIPTELPNALTTTTNNTGYTLYVFHTSMTDDNVHNSGVIFIASNSSTLDEIQEKNIDILKNFILKNVIDLSKESLFFFDTVNPNFGKKFPDGDETHIFICMNHDMLDICRPGVIIIHTSPEAAQELLDEHLITLGCKPYNIQNYTFDIYPINNSSIKF